MGLDDHESPSIILIGVEWHNQPSLAPIVPLAMTGDVLGSSSNNLKIQKVKPRAWSVGGA